MRTEPRAVTSRSYQRWRKMFKDNIKPDQIERKWHLVDAENKVLGRLASKVTEILRGKHRPYYSPQWDMGDHVVVVNAEKVLLTGKKDENKTYIRHSGYAGGLKEIPVDKLRKSQPEQLIIHAVKGMLPKNRLAGEVIKKLHVYAGPQHPHQAQQPDDLPV